MTGSHRLGALAIAGVALAGTAYGVGRHSAAPETSTLTLPAAVQYAQPGLTPVSTTSSAAQGVVVACGAGERALVRPGNVGGAAVSQVECVPDQSAALAMGPSSFGTSRQAFAEPAVYGTPAVYSPSATPSYRAARSTDVVQYRPARRVERRPVRSWKKSAAIIGSSAGIGAGVGGAVGGKKGALIGAAIAGGGATLWDQVTRRK